MHARRKKQIRVPITARANGEGLGMRTAFFVLAALIAAGLLYAYKTRPDLFAQFGKMSTIVAPYL